MAARSPESIAVVVNGSGGRARREGSSLPSRISAAFARCGIATSPRIVAGEDIAAALAEVHDCTCVVVGGGDGTLGSAAAVLAKTGQSMAVLPLGTLNHLSVDLGIPHDLDAAAAIAVDGAVDIIDLAEVNGTTFVNNASIGLYARMVRSREGQRLPKWLATLPAAWTALKALRPRTIAIEADGRHHRIVTPLLFVGNNHYAITGVDRGRRASLNDGKLAVYAVREQSKAGLLAFALRALVGRADPMRDFIGIADVTELTVHGEGTMSVAHDGEVSDMALPLRFRVRPGALRIKVPPSRP